MQNASVEFVTLPAGQFRIGAFGARWSAGFAVRLANGRLLASNDGETCVFRTRKTALVVADDFNRNAVAA